MDTFLLCCAFPNFDDCRPIVKTTESQTPSRLEHPQPQPEHRLSLELDLDHFFGDDQEYCEEHHSHRIASSWLFDARRTLLPLQQANRRVLCEPDSLDPVWWASASIW